MPDLDNDAIIGDGVIIIELNEEIEMSADVPAGMLGLMMTETAGNIQANNQSGRALSTAAMGSLQAGIAKTHNELGPVESRSVSGVIATPVAGPAVQQGP